MPSPSTKDSDGRSALELSFFIRDIGKSFLPSAGVLQPGWLTPREGAVLLDLAFCLPPGSNIVEVGSFCGKSTGYLLLGAYTGGSTLHAIDPFEGFVSQEPESGTKEYWDSIIRRDTRTTFNLWMLGIMGWDRGRLKSLKVHQVKSLPVAQWWATLEQPVDLIFIDGEHHDALADVQAWMSHLQPWGLMVLHDITLSGRYGAGGPDNARAWLLTQGWEEMYCEGTLRGYTKDSTFWQTRLEWLQDHSRGL